MKQVKKYVSLFFILFYRISESFGSTDIELQNDTIHLNTYCQLALKNSETNRDSAIYFSNIALGIAEKLNQKFYQASILSDLGYILLSSGDYSTALTKLLIANKLIEDVNIAKNVIVTPFFSQYFTSNDPKINRIILMGYIKNSLAMLYGRTDNFDRQLSVLKEAKIIIETETNDLNLRFTINTNIANAYLNKGKLDSALIFQYIVLDIERKMENKNYSGASNKAIGDIYFRKGNFNEAKINYIKGLNLMKKGQNIFYLALSQFALADTYRKLGKVDSSLYYSKEGIKNYRILGTNVPEMEEAYTALALSFRDENMYDSAYYYMQLSKKISDSLFNREITTLTTFQNIGFKENMRLQEVETKKIKLEARKQILLLLAGLSLFSIIAFILYLNTKIKVRANMLLAEQKRQIEHTLVDLKSTQAQLIQSEKMASLGELTAGIAHEIQNPLNFVNNFSEVNKELLGEMNEELVKGNLKEVQAIANDVIENSEKINHHGKRAESIVKGMLEHSRKSSGIKEPTDINKLCDEFVRLGYHGLRAKDQSFNCDYKLDLDPNLPLVNVVSQDIGRVLLNIINNAFQAADQKRKNLVGLSVNPQGDLRGLSKGDAANLAESSGAHANSNLQDYHPAVTVSTKNLDDKIEIHISDNGSGIPDSIKDKIFQPFFTTKPAGKGTGLGLSLAYDIVKAHGGTIEVRTHYCPPGGELKAETKEARSDDPVGRGEGSEFIIQLPI